MALTVLNKEYIMRKITLGIILAVFIAVFAYWTKPLWAVQSYPDDIWGTLQDVMEDFLVSAHTFTGKIISSPQLSTAFTLKGSESI